MLIIDQKSTEAYAKRQAGGKGYNLYLLTREGFPVPPWVVLGADVFRRFVAVNGLASVIMATLDSARATGDYKKASDALHEAFMKAHWPPDVAEKCSEAVRRLDLSQKIAVRSSALDEDSAQHSFAGQLSTFLFIGDEASALDAIKKCWASAYSERGLAYRAENNLEFSEKIGVAVVLQEMVHAEKSGVMFTCDPIGQDGSKTVINAVYGLGEGLVSGLLDADTYTLEKASPGTPARELSREIVTKSAMLVQDPAGGTLEVEVDPALREASSLGSSELEALCGLGQKVEAFYRYPQDIEWAIAERSGQKAIVLLQSRPVTTPVRSHDGYLYVWDNSNIIESYGGLTQPLTFSFAHFVYHQVYIQFCEILMVPRREIRNMDYFLRNMLGLFYGRVYYNLLNWYKLTSILPGFKYNRSFMETMMGTSTGLADEIADRIKPPGFEEKFSSKIRRFVTGLKFLYFHFTIQSVVDRFMKYFHPVYDSYRRRDYSRMTSHEIYELYQELERKLLREWKAPIINDYLCMVHFGLLKKLTSAWFSGPTAESLQNDLLCGEGNLESAEPTRELIRMTALVAGNPALRVLIETTPAPDCLEALQQSRFEDFKGRVAAYIDKYGFRCMSEMKLEQRDLHMDPSFLFVCIKNYLNAGQIDLEEYEKREKEIRLNAEKRAAAELSGWRKAVYFWSLKHARKAVRNRENTRFCRTRVYGVVRRMFYGIGRDFALRGILEKQEDVFYLTLQEMAGALEGTLTVQDLKAQAQLRKAEYARYADIEPVPRFLTRGPVYWMNQHTAQEETTAQIPTDLPENCVAGIGCCPGVVEGRVKVILSPEDDLTLNGEILVTLRTDPGWIPLYPAASGLLVERGGLLSHSAIVAREMGLPTVVGVKGLTQKLKTGMRIRLDGKSGVVQILSDVDTGEAGL